MPQLFIDLKDSASYNEKARIYDISRTLETYQSGRNEAHSKCVCPPGHAGSNPAVSAKKEPLDFQWLFFYILGSYSKYVYSVTHVRDEIFLLRRSYYLKS